jgi:hypothetical protein
MVSPFMMSFKELFTQHTPSLSQISLPGGFGFPKNEVEFSFEKSCRYKHYHRKFVIILNGMTAIFEFPEVLEKYHR